MCSPLTAEITPLHKVVRSKTELHWLASKGNHFHFFFASIHLNGSIKMSQSEAQVRVACKDARGLIRNVARGYRRHDVGKSVEKKGRVSNNGAVMIRLSGADKT